MKRGLIFLVLLLLLISGCGEQPEEPAPADETQEEIEDVADTPEEDVPEEPEETPEEPEEDVPEEPEETPEEDVPEEKPKSDLPEDHYKLFIGNSITIGANTFTFNELAYGPRVYYTVDARDGMSVQTKYWEILEGLYINPKEIYNNGYTSPNTYVVFELKPMELTSDQFYFEQNLEYEILGHTFSISEVNSDGWAYLTIENTGNLNKGIKPGTTKTFNAGDKKFKVTLLESYKETRQYAIFEITTVTS